MSGFLALMRRELALAWGGGGGPLLGLTFFATIATLVFVPVVFSILHGRAPKKAAAPATGDAYA